MTILREGTDLTLSLTLDAACLIALAGFLVSFIRSSNKSYGSIMIIVLTLSYFGYPAINIYTLYSITNQEPTRLQGSIAVAISIFNLYWTAAFALFTYLVSRSIISVKFFNFRKFIFLITLTCLIATLLFPLMIYLDIWGDHVHFIVHGLKTIGCYVDDSPARISFILVRDLIGRLIPTLATSICYFQLYSLLKDSSDIVSFSRQALLRLCLYSTIPLVCAIPGILNDFSNNFASSYLSKPITTVIMVLRYFWEFLNLWAYWKLNPSKERTLSSRSVSRSASTANSALLSSEL